MDLSRFIISIFLLFELSLAAVGSENDRRLSVLEEQWSVSPRKKMRDNLQMREGASFKIALFADLHFGEATSTEWGPQQDLKSIKVMATVLDKERPDFVVYLGDVVTANNIAIQNASLYWDQAISPTRDRNIPWATIFGNHDDASFEWPIEWFSGPGIPPTHCAEKHCFHSGGNGCRFRGTTRLELVHKEIKHNSLSYTQGGPKNLWPSVSNYVLQLSSSNDTKSPVAFIYFFDSGGGSYPEVISSAQADWFRQKSHDINPDSKVPEIILWHIPSQAYQKVAPRLSERKKCVGSLFNEDIAPQEAEFGIMKILEDRPSVKAIFVGHNHGLDWCCPNKKMWLCFARHSGYGGYGSWDRGSRILEITESPFSLKSWIRMEDGHSHSQLILSS